ncbi:YncE family protein [Pseudomonas sp. Irchel 3E19]|uniref:YncE family protein n=1 Tax=Pseudomonas sp. Irchel 3E19 TaxID=2008981 RepID=UPI000BA4545E|nr:YncE family protein [Pseudomonas sp. Irchel 3E19]
MNSPVTDPDPASNQMLVFPPVASGFGVFAVKLSPPYPVGFKLQEDGALGLGINLVSASRHGLLVYILVYLNMSVGDNIKVFIKNQNAPVAEFSVTEAHFDANHKAKNIPFYISVKDLEARFSPQQKTNEDFWFEVVRVSGNTTESSDAVKLFYKYPAPGEADPDGGKPFNQGLKLPVASESVVDQTVIKEGMFVTVRKYDNQSIGDIVVLAFGTLELETKVTELGDVIFELTPQMLARLPLTDSVIVRWGAFDVVENSSGWSDAQILAFKPGAALLRAPVFDPADANDVVNHDSLKGYDMNIIVIDLFAKGDVIELILTAVTKSGEQVTHTYSQTLNVTSRVVTFAVKNEWVRNLIGGSALASYRLTRAGKTQLSKTAEATFKGTSHPLGLPTIEPLVEGKLPVETAIATVTLASYWPLKEGAIVKLRWQTTDKNGIVALFIFQQIITVPTQPVIFKIDAPYIAPYPNTPLTVQVTITNTGEREVTSGLLNVMFGEPAVVELRPPFLVAPAQNPINTDLYPDGIIVRVEHLPANPGVQARLELLNALPGTPFFAPRPLNDRKRANFTLDHPLLKRHEGRNLRVRWVLISDNVETPSAELRLRILAPQTTLTFDNGPYSIAPAGRFTLRLTLAKSGFGLSGETVKITIPAGLTFRDGKGGTQDFVTDEHGKITVIGVVGHTTTGEYSLTAAYGTTLTAKTAATVRAQGPIGTIGIPNVGYFALSPDGNRIYASSNTGQSATLSVVDTVSLKVIHTLSFLSASGVSVSPDNSLIYFTGSLTAAAGPGLFVIDATSFEIVGNLPFNNLNFGGGQIALSPDCSHAYIAGGAFTYPGTFNGRLLVVKTSSLAVLHTIVLQQNNMGVTVSPDGEHVYATNANGTTVFPRFVGSVSIIETKTHSVLRHIEVGTNPHDIAVSPDGHHIYIAAMESLQRIEVIDTRTNTVVRYVPIGIASWALALSADGRYLCASEWNGVKDTVIVDTTTFNVRRIPGGGNCISAAMSADGTRAYFSNFSANQITVHPN